MNPMSVQVLIPWREVDRHRAIAFGWVTRHLNDRYGYGPVTLGTSNPWNKGRAFHQGLQRTSSDIIVLHDADVWCEGLAEAVCAVGGGAPWAIPHRNVIRLTESGTEAYVASADSAFKQRDLARPPYVGILGGGIVVAHRDVFLDVPIDPRFEGWGQEDESHGAALETLYGHPWRGEADLVHLWHPPQPKITNRWGSEANRRLFQEHYHPAIGHPEQMRTVINEAKKCLLPS